MKKFFKGFAVAVTAGLVALVAAGCSQPHEHKFGTEWKMDSAQHWHECECGEMKDESVHHYGEWVVTEEATETETGTRTKTCTDCGFIYTESIPKLFVQWNIRGDMNGWCNDGFPEESKFKVNNGVGRLVIRLDETQSFKIAANQEWDNQFNAANVIAADGLLAEGNDNIKVAKTGWYEITITDNNDLAKAKCTITPLQFYIRGDMNSWGNEGFEEKDKFTVDQTTLQATLEYTIEAGQNFKIATVDWATNFGATTITAPEGLITGTDNINVKATGTYVFTIDLTAEKLVCAIALK